MNCPGCGESWSLQLPGEGRKQMAYLGMIVLVLDDVNGNGFDGFDYEDGESWSLQVPGEGRKQIAYLVIFIWIVT